MRVSHWLCPTSALGPGKRLALWVQGCGRNCPGCIAPELRKRDAGTYVAAELLAELLRREMEESRADGLTISGGEPLDQLPELLVLLQRLNPIDCLLYTGYPLEEVKRMPDFKRLEPYLGVLITDPYIQELDDGKPLRGSSNQRILVMKPELLKRYKEYGNGSRSLEFTEGGEKIYFAGLPG
jgi:anaerobic ribonucleoside-triphosphate reductase activating protein